MLAEPVTCGSCSPHPHMLHLRTETVRPAHHGGARLPPGSAKVATRKKPLTAAGAVPRAEPAQYRRRTAHPFGSSRVNLPERGRVSRTVTAARLGLAAGGLVWPTSDVTLGLLALLRGSDRFTRGWAECAWERRQNAHEPEEAGVAGRQRRRARRASPCQVSPRPTPSRSATRRGRMRVGVTGFCMGGGSASLRARVMAAMKVRTRDRKRDAAETTSRLRPGCWTCCALTSCSRSGPGCGERNSWA